MVFSSIPFLFFFLPPVLGLYYIVPFKYKNAVLLVFSLIFYAWGEPVYILLMLFCIVFNYLCGLFFGKCTVDSKRRLALIVSIIVNLGILGFFKYGDFLIEQLNALLSLSIQPLELGLPIGISFFTFQTMSYTIDVYRKDIPVERNIVCLATYVSMFPQLIAGPIVRFSTINSEMHARTIDMDGFVKGFMRFLRGLFKKVLLANSIGMLWDSVSAHGSGEISALTAWFGIAGYTLQLYFDFSSYSDMAIGMGLMLGFHFDENFNFPLISKSATEFWRRWHISLGSFFRDYVYIPLGGNRCSVAKQIRNILIVWFLTGFWHGAAWNFAMWGVYYGIILLLEKFVIGKFLKKLPDFLQHMYLLFIVVLGFELFVFDDFTRLTSYLSDMFMLSGNAFADSGFLFYLRSYGAIFVIAALFATPVAELLRHKAEKLLGEKQQRLCSVLISCGYIVMLFFTIASMVNDSYNPFLYFRF